MATSREYKDRLFSFIFGREEHKDWTLSLYNAVRGSHYTNPDDIQITTIRDVLYLGMHNDVSFIIANELSLYEQQSTYNPNMPIREFLYAAKLLEQYLAPKKMELYWKKLVRIPAPKLVVFYNGRENHPDETLLKLSDAYPDGIEGDIEVKVRMLNINFGHSKKLFDACQPLREYTWLVEKIRDLTKITNLEEAVDRAINEMPNEFRLKTILIQHKAEVKGMILTEYDEQEAMNSFREEGRQEGRQEGVQEGLVKGMIALIQQGAINAEVAANNLQMTVEQFWNRAIELNLIEHRL